MDKVIKIYRTPMGDIIGCEDKVENEIYHLSDVLSVQVTQEKDPSGQITGVQVGFGSVAPFSKDATSEAPQISIQMPSTNVLFSYDPSEDLIEGYMDVIEPKKIVTLDKKIITPN